jgi:hypothetical protein
VTPQTTIGWILFAVMWLSGPIAGYAASELVATAWAREPIQKRDLLAVSISAASLVIAALLLVFAENQ